MKPISLLGLVLFFIINSRLSPIVNGQPPGYLGKRATLTIGVSSFPTVNGPTQNNNGKSFFGESTNRKWGVDYEIESNFSYVTSRQSSFGITLGQFNTGMTTDAQTESLVSNPFSNFDPIDYHDLLYQLKVRTISLIHNKYRFRKGALAPFGNYFFWGLKRSFISGKVIDKKTSYHIGEAFGHRSLEIDPKAAYSSLILGWSNHQIYWDKVMVKVGFRFGVPLNLFSNKDPESNQEKFSHNATRRLWRHEVVRIDFGVGYLLF